MDSLIRRCGWLLAGVLASGIAGAAEPAKSMPACFSAGEKMAFGYFDHTAAWYRQRPKFKPDQTIAHSRRAGDREVVVVLYSDVSGSKEGTDPDDGNALDTGRRMEERSADIASYLDAAHRHGNVRVLLQVPPEVARRWTSDPEAPALLTQFVSRWSEKPALAGFYVFDEPELSGIPASTLQKMREVVRKHATAGRNATAISVAQSAVTERKPLLQAYLGASPRAFDVILVNRYPIFREYIRDASKSDAGFEAKLGAGEGKPGRMKLADNEFANLDDYPDSIAAAAGLKGLDGRPLYASVQAYGLRDDCDGPDCTVRNERKPHRSPTWNELLYMFTTVWDSGAQGAVLYSHYFALYDKALRKRLANFDRLTGDVFPDLPACGSGIRVRTQGGGRAGSDAAAGVMARYAARQPDGKPGYAVVMNRRRGKASVQIEFGKDSGIRHVELLDFSPQGVAGAAQKTATINVAGGGPGLQLQLDGHEVRIFRLLRE